MSADFERSSKIPDVCSNAPESGSLLSNQEKINTETNSTTEATSSSNKHLNVLPFAVIVFYNVSGGPFGIEPTVRAGGPLFSILGFLFFFLVWSIPEALVTAELASTYPHASGGVAWVEEAFGRKASSVMGYISWISGATDNAIYPVLFMVYLKQIIQTDIGDQDTQYEDDEGFRYVLTLVSIATALTFMNYLGLEIVGNMSLVIAAISLSPFLIMCIFGMFKIKPSRLMVMSSPDSSTFFFDDDNGVDGDDGEGVWGLKSSIIHIPNVFNVMWRPFLNNIFWNVNSFDSAANLSKEVKNLKECFTRGMLQAIIFCALSYLLPLIVALGAVETKQEDWVDGYIATVAIDIVGKWLGQWMVVAAGISNIGLFIAELSADSYQLMGMAEKGLWPKIFAHRSRFDTPTYSILLCYFVILSLLFNDYNELLAIMNFNYAISLIMEYAAFIKLRLRKHDRPQPFRVPLNTLGCILMLVPGVLTMLVMFLSSNYLTLIYSIVFLILGLVIFSLQNVAKDKNWCLYADHEEIADNNHLVSEANDSRPNSYNLDDTRPQNIELI